MPLFGFAKPFIFQGHTICRRYGVLKNFPPWNCFAENNAFGAGRRREAIALSIVLSGDHSVFTGPFGLVEGLVGPFKNGRRGISLLEGGNTDADRQGK